MVVEGRPRVDQHEAGESEGERVGTRKTALAKFSSPETGSVTGTVQKTLTGAQHGDVATQPASGTATIRT